MTPVVMCQDEFRQCQDPLAYSTPPLAIPVFAAGFPDPVPSLSIVLTTFMPCPTEPKPLEPQMFRFDASTCLYKRCMFVLR
jgi:hypothetical protein